MLNVSEPGMKEISFQTYWKKWIRIQAPVFEVLNFYAKRGGKMT